MKILGRTFYVNVLPVILFIGMVVVDNINGYLQEFSVSVPISLLCRGGIFIVTLPFLFKPIYNGGIAVLFRWLMVIYILAIPIWILVGQPIDLVDEFDYLFRFIYFFAIFFYFYYYRNSFSIVTILHLIINAAFVIAVLNILCYILGIGVKSYGDDYGFGTKAFFIDGNTLGLYMVLSTCISVWYAFYKKGIWLLMAVIITCGTMLIGSRASIFGSVIIWIAMVLFVLFKSRDIIRMSWVTKLVLCIVIGGTIIGGVFTLTKYIANFDAYTQTRFSIESAVAPRERLIAKGTNIIADFNTIECLIGKSRSGALTEMGGAYYLFSDDKKSIEADFHDMIMCFGWVFGGLMILIQLMIAWRIVRTFLRIPSSFTFVLSLFAILWIGASYMAGHGFNNTMLAPLIGAVFMISDKIGETRDGRIAL